MSRYTPVRVALAVCLGIVFSISLPIFPVALFRHITWILFSLFIITLIVFRSSFRFKWVPGLVALITLFTAGVSVEESVRLKRDGQDLIIREESSFPVKVLIMEERPVGKSGRYSGIATVAGILDTSLAYCNTNVPVSVNFGKDSDAAGLMPGDMIFSRCEIRNVDPPVNPYAFDYRRYLSFKGVRWQTYLDSGNWLKSGRVVGNGPARWAEKTRQRFVKVLENYGIAGEELGLASALILGTRDLLDKEMIREFSNAGAIHVLSVSGLHVGIMYVLADRLLFLLKRGRAGRKMHHFLIIGLIWLYSLLTGFPPSVVRASLMFSLLSVSKMMTRDQEGYNILAGALVLQLWIDPYQVTQVGLQLSYIAVLGIFLFYKPINQLFSDSKALISWIWSIMAVSLAAQLATFPLTSYYFGFFPLYFLVTNLVVVPLAAVVVYLALLVLLAGICHLPFTWIGLPLKWALFLMHRSVAFIQSWPGAVVEPINISMAQALLLYILMACGFLYLMVRSKKAAWIFMGSMTVLTLTFGIDRIQRVSAKGITVYSIKNHQAIDFLKGQEVIFLADSSLRSSQTTITSQVEPNRRHWSSEVIREIDLNTIKQAVDRGFWMNYPFISFDNKTFALLDRHWDAVNDSIEIRVDVAVISGRKLYDPAEALSHFRVNQVVLDGTVPAYLSERWKLACAIDSIPCHSVLNDGAFVWNW